MLCDYSRAIESDLSRWHREDLRTIGRGLTYRRLGVLVAGLPDDSLLARAVSKDAPEREPTAEEERAIWTLTNQLLAGIKDEVAGANYQRGGGKGAKPKPTPRPGVDATGVERVASNPSPLTPEQKRAAIARVAPRREED